MTPLITLRRLLLAVAFIAAILSGYTSFGRWQHSENLKREAGEVAESLRNGYYIRTAYTGLERTFGFEESELQSELSKRLLKLTNESALADFEALADCIERNPLEYKELGNRGHWRREEGAGHAVAFRRYAIHSPAQRQMLRTRRMGEEDGPSPDPPHLSSTEVASVAELERLSPIFKAVRVHSSLNLSDKQKEFFAEFTEIVQTGVQWIKQYEYPDLYFPNDPSFGSEDPKHATTVEAMLHADQFVLLKILTAEQYDQLVPDVIGEREEFPRRNLQH